MRLCVLTVIGFFLSSCGVALAGDEQPGACRLESTARQAILECTVETIKKRESEQKTIEEIITAEPVRTYLLTLAENIGYEGSAADLLELKRRSTALKGDPRRNALPILLLDNAIASNGDELRSAVSFRTLAQGAHAGDNIYAGFVHRKLAFLSSDKGIFYYGGPFELDVLTLLGNSLEAEFFWKRQEQKVSDERLLDHELNVITDVLTLPIRLTHTPTTFSGASGLCRIASRAQA